MLVVLEFPEFSTQPLNDVVRVFQCSDMQCSQQQQLAELSGTYADVQSITSTTGYIRVTFTTDGRANYDGFSASWSSVIVHVCFYRSSDDLMLHVMSVSHGMMYVWFPCLYLITLSVHAGKQLLMQRLWFRMWAAHCGKWDILCQNWGFRLCKFGNH